MHRRSVPIDPHLQALSDMRPRCFWLDQEERPAALPALEGREEADLAIVGGGFAGLWSALHAKERNPGREVVVVEGTQKALPGEAVRVIERLPLTEEVRAAERNP